MAENKQDDFVVEGHVAKTLAEGAHTGTIVDVERDTSGKTPKGEPTDYTRLLIEVDGTDGMVIKQDFPTNVSNKSSLGAAIKTFTGKEVGEEKYDLKKIFENRKVKFMTLNVPGKKGGEFANIVDKSLKPLE